MQLIIHFNAAIIKFGKRDHLLKEGEFPRSIFQILSGNCSVIKTTQGKPNVVGVLGPGDVAGEISFLTKKPSTASIVANCSVTAYAIDSHYIDTILWDQDPQLVLRFCRYLCAALVSRVSNSMEKIKE
jgi:extracellular factor (EF) 3-hydroxypalmitic acid methyl ester biosynthesis protein